MEDAMILPDSIKETRTGVFTGSWKYEYVKLCEKSEYYDFFRSYMGNSVAATAARLSHFFGTTGPCIATESGCSSGIAAVDLACKSLQNGECDLAFAGATNLIIEPFTTSMIEMALSPDFRCKTFDANANGFARAEGCAVLMLKRLSDAIRDENNIWGVVRGSALSQEGLSRSLGTPTVDAQVAAMELALSDARIEPNKVSFLEADGTGTAVGDLVEVAAIGRVYSKNRKVPLIIGSVKTNIGHTESVSGISGIIKVILAMKNQMIPKHINLTTPNPNIDFESIPAKIPLEETPWPISPHQKRIAAVSCFGITGTNGHVIIEEPCDIPKFEVPFNDERPLHIMKLSAKSEGSLEKLLEEYGKLFETEVRTNGNRSKALANIAYSTNVGRSTFDHRAVVIAKDISEASRILKNRSFELGEVEGNKRRLCFLFAGQGSQYPNMASELYRTSPLFREVFDYCDEILQKRYRVSIKEVMWSTDSSKSKDLDKTLYSQTSIFVVEYCIYKLWSSWGVKPDYVLGHSLGEFAAAVAAGVLNLEDALMLVTERAKLITSLPNGKMLVVQGDQGRVESVVSEAKRVIPSFWVDYAAFNSPEQTVVSGDSEMVEAFAKLCKAKTIKVKVLASAHAFHSRHMDAIVDEYGEIAARVQKFDRKKPDELPVFVSSVLGTSVNADKIDTSYWVRHLRENVNFLHACQTVCLQEGVTLFLEVGPHPVLSALVMQNIHNPITCLPSIRKGEGNWVTMLHSVAKLHLSDWRGEIDWKGFDKFYHREKVNLPFYPFEKKRLWMNTKVTYPKIHKMLGKFVPTASGGICYENSLNLKVIPFIKDHVVGSTIMFPGAGFLELCLAGGHCAMQEFQLKFARPTRPVGIKKLKINFPLALNESKPATIQTVANFCSNKDTDGEVSYELKVFSYEETDNDKQGQWIEHVSSIFIVFPEVLPFNDSCVRDISAFQTKSENICASTFYKRLPGVGLHFGPKFESITNIWRNSDGTLIKIKIPEDKAVYIMHPLIADAMLQALILSSNYKNIKKLMIPVQIEDFVWLECSDFPDLYIFCPQSKHNTANMSVLLNGDGKWLAYMRGVDFMETTYSAMEGLAQSNNRNELKLWKYEWRSFPGPAQCSLSMQEVSHASVGPQGAICFSEKDEKFYEQANAIPSKLEFRKNMELFSLLSFLKTFVEVGWGPEKDEEFSVADIIAHFNICERHTDYVHFIFRYLARELPFFEVVDKQIDRIRLRETLPTWEELQDRVDNLAELLQYSQEQVKLTRLLSRNLYQILQGKVEPLSILFPDDSSKPSVQKMYESWIQVRGNVIQRSAESIFLPPIIQAAENFSKTMLSPDTKPKYRILEIGAGTCSWTVTMLEVLSRKAANFDIEYYVTDVSTAQFERNKEVLKHFLKHVTFKRFDMDIDPLEQGFCPGYFDSICAFEVVHVAKDVKMALKNIRSLLKVGGNIMLMETTVPDVALTFAFGLLPGYWQFEDRHFRKYHTTMSISMWKEALLESGFTNFGSIEMDGGRHALILAVASVTTPPLNRAIVTLKNTWIIFGNRSVQFSQGLASRLEQVNRKCILVDKSDVGVGLKEEKGFADMLSAYLDRAQKGKAKLEGIIFAWSLSPDTRDQREISLPFVSIIKMVLKMNTFGNKFPRLYIITQGAINVGIDDVVEPDAGPLLGICQSVANEHLALNISLLDLDPGKEPCAQLEEIFLNLWVELNQPTAFRDGNRFFQKLVEEKVDHFEDLHLPKGCSRFQLTLPESGSTSDLEFSRLSLRTLKEDEVEVEIKAVSLNFRDFHTILKPISDFEAFNSIGLEYTGIITKKGKSVREFQIGQRVIGVNTTQTLSLPSHINVCESLLIPLSNHMTFVEGVTLPVAFFTAFHCLLNIAKVAKDDTVLIHTASGGVGLAAIQLCKLAGANIIATAGSKRKQRFLKNKGIEFVCDSRDTNFREEILKVTKNRGVDVVLNTLTDPGFKEATLDVLGKNGKFIELSRMNIWTADEVRALRKDVSYRLVNFTELKNDEFQNLTVKLGKYLQRHLLDPLPYVRFDTRNVREALAYSQAANHIGKVVCVMPEFVLDESKLLPRTPLFDEDSTYIVTGGCGGIGGVVIKWMLEQGGAKHIVIATLTPPISEVTKKLESYKKSGKHVEVFHVDVGDYESCKKMFEKIQSSTSGFPKIRGIFHLAGKLRDGTIENQTWETFLETYNAKISGTWNLHELSKNLMLEYFVLFSSIAPIVGSTGQSNHSGGNSFLDAFASYRQSLGLPATSINYGNWSEVGSATEVSLPGVKPISNSQGIYSLNAMLKTHSSHLVPFNVYSFNELSKAFPRIKQFVTKERLSAEKELPLKATRDTFWKDIKSAESKEQRIVLSMELLKTLAKNILKMHESDSISDTADFNSIGIDSLHMLQMINGIRDVVGNAEGLPLNQLKNNFNIKDLAETLVSILDQDARLKPGPLSTKQ